MRFDKDTTYFQSLKHVTRELIQWPVCRDTVADLVEGVLIIMRALFEVTIRALALLMLPVSAPLLTFFVRADQRRTQRNYPAGIAGARSQRDAARDQSHPAAHDTSANGK